MKKSQAERIRRGIIQGTNYLNYLQNSTPYATINMFELIYLKIGADKLAWKAYERVTSRGIDKWVASGETPEEKLRRGAIVIQVIGGEIDVIRGNHNR